MQLIGSLCVRLMVIAFIFHSAAIGIHHAARWHAWSPPWREEMGRERQNRGMRESEGGERAQQLAKVREELKAGCNRRSGKSK